MREQPLRAYWAEAATQNWGDVIAPIIIERFAGEMPIRITEDGGRFLTVGTLIQPGYLKAGDHIWGSGYNYPEVIPQALGLTFHAVRGPLSRRELVAQGWNVPEIYGDPALLLPYMFQPRERRKRFPVSIVPHMGVPPQKVAALRALSPHVHVINIRGGVFPVLQEILASESVLSSSLHGIVAAEAYGIPVRFVQLHEWPDDGNDEYFKYNDYFASTERPPTPPLDWRGAVTLDMVEREAELLRRATRSALRIDLMPIVRACPFNRLDIARPEDLRLEYIDIPT